MAAFQPSDDETHDLGTETKRWENLYVKNIIATGTATGITATSSETLSVYTPPGTNYIVDESGETDQVILHDTGTVILPDASESEGRLIRVINNNETSSIAIKTYSQDQNIYSFGFAIPDPNTVGLSAQSHSVATLICTGLHWYSA